jgi:hypothetical protein
MTFVAYFDECGDEGFAFREPHRTGSSEWFVLGAALHAVTARRDIIHHHTAFRERHRKDANWHFHFTKASHDERVGFIEHMRGAPYICMSVAVHKPSLTHTEAFQRPYYLYFYTARLLLERISWYCRDHRPPGDTGDGCAWLVFSSRRGLRKPDIEEYLGQLQRRSSPTTALRILFSNSIHWPVLATDCIQVVPNKTYVGLQMADAVASSVGRAFERSAYGNTEPRYIETLKPQLYRSWGTYFSYGVKIFPKMSDALRAEDRFNWIANFR